MDKKFKYHKNITKMFVQGPTFGWNPLDYNHLGHARVYIMIDLIRRTINNIMNLNTFLVMKIDDIDKTHEKFFFESMTKLRIKMPDIVIRASEIMPKIIAYVQKIVDNGFGYVTSDGSVYFDSKIYADQGFEDIKDFALWKKLPKSEIGFDAEFIFEGKIIKSWGQPEWHIECSTIIYEIIGPQLDIYFIDPSIDPVTRVDKIRLLNHIFYHPKFKPNHNHPELNKQWFAEFMHMGGLNDDITKKFITINDILKKITTNQLRWIFVMHKWQDPMVLNDDVMSQAKNYDDMICNFFDRIILFFHDKNHCHHDQKEFELLDYFYKIRIDIICSLLTFEFDVMALMLQKLINNTNAYIDIKQVNEKLLREIGTWIANLLNNIGFMYEKIPIKLNLNINTTNTLIDIHDIFLMLKRITIIPKEIKQII
jgi:cysteinyl-tRNA synthetase